MEQEIARQLYIRNQMMGGNALGMGMCGSGAKKGMPALPKSLRPTPKQKIAHNKYKAYCEKPATGMPLKMKRARKYRAELAAGKTPTEALASAKKIKAKKPKKA
jgi:hypothetical protein